jgi:carbonic anhydrase
VFFFQAQLRVKCLDIHRGKTFLWGLVFWILKGVWHSSILIAKRREIMSTKTPEELLQVLMDGNKRFASGNPERPRSDAMRRRELVGGQRPIAAILGCADSRVPPELIFDQGLGDLFVIRVAGNLADDTDLGSLEYAVAHLDVQLIIVLGHENCGAVSAAVEFADSGGIPEGYLASVLDPIDPVAAKPGLPFEARVNETARRHALKMADAVRNAGPTLRTHAASGELKVVAAMYRLADGRIDFLE